MILLDTINEIICRMDATAWMTLVLAITTALVIYWQGNKLKMQIQLQALLELDRDWNKREMRKLRAKACEILKKIPKKNLTEVELDIVEHLFEYLEKICSFQKMSILESNSLWSILGWYIVRYYYYGFEAIKLLRKRWTNDYDPTLYKDMENVYKKLIEREIKERRKNKEDLEEEFKKTRDNFFKSEKNFNVNK